MNASRRAHRLVAAAALAGGPAGGLAVATGWMLWATRRYRYAVASEVPPRPVAIVPGARVMPDGAPSVPLVERLTAAWTLWRAGRVGAIVVSGARRPDGYDEPGAMRRWLRERGLPDRRVAVDPAGHRTFATMRNAARDLGVRGAVICTHAFHLPRSVYLARAWGLDAVGLAADLREVDPHAWGNAAREALARLRAVLDLAVAPPGASGALGSGRER